VDEAGEPLEEPQDRTDGPGGGPTDGVPAGGRCVGLDRLADSSHGRTIAETAAVAERLIARPPPGP
jgi:hypothetical protein